MKQLYTVGYGNISVEQLKQWVEEHQAWLIDVRISPRSRDPQWRRSNLEDVIGFRYQHVPDLGNENFKGGPIKIRDMANGTKVVAQLLESANVVLMCACWSWTQCHRTPVANEVAAATGGTVIHLQKADFPKIDKSSQTKLF